MQLYNEVLILKGVQITLLRTINTLKQLQLPDLTDADRAWPKTGVSYNHFPTLSSLFEASNIQFIEWTDL